MPACRAKHALVFLALSLYTAKAADEKKRLDKLEMMRRLGDEGPRRNRMYAFRSLRWEEDIQKSRQAGSFATVGKLASMIRGLSK